MKAALGLLSALFLFQQAESLQQATRVIRGTVVNLSTGTPLAEATVRVISGADTNLTTTTGRDGRFEFTGLAPRPGSILATAPGFNYPNAPGPPSRGRTFSFESEESVEIRIGLVPAFSVSGRVLDENNQPISRISLQLAEKGYRADGSPALTGAPGNAMSDERGEFRFLNVIPGDYAVQAVRDSVSTYYPGVRFPDQAVFISVSGSDVAGITFPLLPGTKYAIRFRLSGVTPVPQDISVQLPSRSATGIPPFKKLPTTDDGIYTFDGILPGSYRLMIHWYEDQPGAPVNPVARMARTIPFDIVDRDLDLGTIEVERRVSIEGRITFKAMDPFRVNIILEPQTGAISLRSSGWWLGENNTFSISEIPEGRYAIRTSPLPENHYLASAVFNGVDVLGREITIDGAQDGRLDIVFDTPAGGVIGVVRDAKGDPFAEATVVLLPPADRREGLPMSSVVLTDKDGKFSFPRVTPGDYSLFAWEAVPANAYRNADWLSQYEVLATRLTVRKGTISHINPRLIPQKR
jgi:protocatechuate 3,4-dioxygenase beta subunit